MRAFKRTSEPTAEAVALDRLRLAVKVDGHDLDEELALRLAEATQLIEHEYGFALITQTWQLRLDGFPTCGAIEIPRPPLQSVTSIEYVDTAGVTQTWDNTLYRVDDFSEPGRITPAYEQSYPSTRPVTGAVTVTYVAGYGDDESAVPALAKSALLLAAVDLYRNPETIVAGTVSELPSSVSVQRLMRLLRGYKAG